MDKEKKPEVYQIKLLILGDQAVGKSSLMMRYAEETFNLNIMGTAGVDLKKKMVQINGETVKVMIYDTAGHDRFRQITKTQFKGAKGMILVFDLTDKKTFESVSYWMDQIRENADTDVEIMVVGNKIDMLESRQVGKEDVKALSDKFSVPLLETSAKTALNVEEAFMTIIKNIYDKDKGISKVQQTNENIVNTNTTSIPAKSHEQQNKCCNIL